MPWWLWMALGLALLVLELVTPGAFVTFFFGLAALIVGAGLGLGFDLPSWLQGLLFSVLSIGSMLVLRRPLRDLVLSRRRATGEVDSLVGELASPTRDLEPGATGQAELRGTTWTAHNADQRTLRSGERCRVVSVDGLLIWIRGE